MYTCILLQCILSALALDLEETFNFVTRASYNIGSYIYIDIGSYIYTYIYIYTRTHIHIHIHVHIHIHINM